MLPPQRQTRGHRIKLHRFARVWSSKVRMRLKATTISHPLPRFK